MAEADRRDIAVVISRPLDEVVGYLGDPRNWPAWASGLASGIEKAPEGWVVQQPGGPARLRFVAPDEPGSFDHVVTLPDGTEVDVPMRAVAAGEGTEVILTLVRAPTMSDEEFSRDADTMRRDLDALKRALESG